MKKTFRINVVASYSGNVNINNYRRPILDILMSFAWLYNLEYATSINHNFGQDEYTHDLIYFRSTAETSITKKNLSNIISTVFASWLSRFEFDVDVARQIYKVMPQYPFPSVYFRPLSYPYMECHNGKKSSLAILEKGLQATPNVENPQNLN